MHYTKGSIASIELPCELWEQLITSCKEKLKADRLPGKKEKAFGLVAGHLAAERIIVDSIVPLVHNARTADNQKQYMDTMMEQHAIPSITPLEQRGWVAAPEELRDVLHTFRSQNLQLLGSYHIHQVAWQHDPQRDTPTELDTILGKDSRMFMFILSLVNLDAPVIRAFFEGKIDLEVPIVFTP